MVGKEEAFERNPDLYNYFCLNQKSFTFSAVNVLKTYQQGLPFISLIIETNYKFSLTSSLKNDYNAKVLLMLLNVLGAQLNQV